MRSISWLILLIVHCQGAGSEESDDTAATEVTEAATQSVEAAFRELAVTIENPTAVIDRFPSSLPGVTWNSYFGETGFFITGTNKTSAVVAAFVMPIELDQVESDDATVEAGFTPVALGATADSELFPDLEAVRVALISDIDMQLAEGNAGARRYQSDSNPISQLNDCSKMILSFWSAANRGIVVIGATALCGAAALWASWGAAVPACAILPLTWLGYEALRGLPCSSFLRCAGACNSALGDADGMRRIQDCNGFDRVALCAGVTVQSNAACGQSDTCPTGTMPITHPCDNSRILSCTGCSASAGSMRRGQGYVVDECQDSGAKSESESGSETESEPECRADLQNGSCNGSAFVCSGWNGAGISPCEGPGALCCPPGMCRYDYPAVGISHCVEIVCNDGASNANTGCVCECTGSAKSLYDECGYLAACLGV